MKTTPGSSSARKLWRGITHLIFPNLCVACGRDALSGSSCFCFQCRRKLSFSTMYELRENEFTQRLWGRLPLVSGAALLHYTRKNPIQYALHLLKYKNKPEIGWSIGREFGQKLQQTALYQGIEVVVPVPLHLQKERTRGYNQSLMFARGIAEMLAVPVVEQAIVRRTHTRSQTQKKRLERHENVQNVFALSRPAALEGKHILLVDDVLTTGATLEVCGSTLLSLSSTRLSCVTIAIAM